MRALTILFFCAGFSVCFPSENTAAKRRAPALTDEEVARAAAAIDAELIDSLLKWQAQMTAQKRSVEAQPALVPANDSDFLRRACLDAIGRIPTADEAREFLDDKTQDKRARLIDRLLASDEWGDQQFHRLAGMFRITDKVLGASQQPYIDWVRDAARKDMPLDRLTLAMLTASGSLNSNPATGFLLRDGGPMFGIAGFTAMIFLGCDIHCAGCHDHPFSDWTQKEYYQFAACLGATTVRRASSPVPKSTLDEERRPLFPGAKPLPRRSRAPATALAGDTLWPAPLRSPPPQPLAPGDFLKIEEIAHPALTLGRDYKYRDGKPGDVVRPSVLSLARTKPVAEKSLPASNTNPSRPAIREEWADWIIKEPRFAETLALRMWDQVFGLPLYFGTGIGWEPRHDPQQMVRAMFEGGCSTEASGSIACSLFDQNDGTTALKSIIGRLGRIMKEARFDARDFQRILMHTEAYQRAVTVSVYHGWGHPWTFSPQPRLRRMTAEQAWDSIVRLGDVTNPASPLAAQLPQSLPFSHPLRILGRGSREWNDDSVPAISFALCRWMLNGEIIHRSAEVAARANPDVESLFLATLSRRPTENEASAAKRHLAAYPGDLASIAQALINTSEFLFIR